MPGFDRTGPAGQGSRTGRQLGKCTSTNNSNDETIEEDRLQRGVNRTDLGRGLGRGPGRGRGRGRGLGRQ